MYSLQENGPDSTPSRKRRSLSARRPLTSRHFELTAEQRYVLEAVKGGRNVFFTGGAGTGKSFLVRKCIGALPPDATFVTASTGVAAYQGHYSVHSIADDISHNFLIVHLNRSCFKGLSCFVIINKLNNDFLTLNPFYGSSSMSDGVAHHSTECRPRLAA